jgi:hypothetical protein
MIQIVKDEYGRPFYLHNADDAWKATDRTVNIDWGTWEPVAFAGEELKEEEKEAWATVTDTDAQLITEAVIQETASFIEELNNLTLSAPNEERANIYFLIESIGYAMKQYLRGEKD